MSKTVTLIIVLSLGLFSLLGAQEVLVPAGIDHGHTSSRKSARAEVPADTLELPFFDDFSREGSFPYPYFWKDRSVHINNTYSKDPVTIGMATLDAIDSKGMLNGSLPVHSESDFLTSRPLNLNYPGRQDIWLSFFYGRWGLGDAPEEQDSLIVEFFAPDSMRWESVWSAPGILENPPTPEDTFKQVFIHVNAERFLKKGFQFRFKNYASIRGDAGTEDKKSNVDHWNIDYVYLDTARSDNITALNDVSMISSLGSILNSYEAIPWRHFSRAYLTELKPDIEISYRNNDTTTRNVTRILKITDLNYQETDSVNGGAVNVQPGGLNTYAFPYNYPFIFYDADSTVFEIKSYLVTEDLDYKINDTVIRRQLFYNYYAYDDGSAENGYGLRGEGTANASIAYKFKTFIRDTLRAVDMYFNRTQGDASQDYFYLAVWEHNTELDAPGQLIHAMSGARPEYADELNRFRTYILDTLIIVSGEFYVGWIKTTERMLNVGWDNRNNNQSKIYYNLGQEWVNTGFRGSLMVRPVMGKEVSWPAGSEDKLKEPELRLYPNPASDIFQLELSGVETPPEGMVDIYNLQGKLVYRERASNTTHYIGDLPEGLYILRISHKGRHRASSKLMIIR